MLNDKYACDIACYQYGFQTVKTINNKANKINLGWHKFLIKVIINSFNSWLSTTIYYLLLIKQMEEQKPDINNMWGCMFAGDTQIHKLKEKAIVLVGDSRAGKSTIFNYILHKSMIGSQLEDEGEVIYKPTFQQGVATANHFQSVTLVPNTEPMYVNGQEVSLVDMAGFYDQKRSYVGIFGVSFMLERVLQKLQAMKFILVVSHNHFEADQLSDFIKPFLGIIKILQIDTLLSSDHKKIIQIFLNSIALVVVRASLKAKSYLSKIMKAMKDLQNSDINERKAVYILLKSIHTKGRIQIFKRAEDGEAPEQSTIIESLSEPDKHWNYYDFSQNSLKKEHLFKIPFQKDLESMKKSDKQSYKKATDQKKADLCNSFALLRKFAKRAVTVSKKKLSEDPEDFQEEENWFSDCIDYSAEFNELQAIISNHPYGSSLQTMLDDLGVLPEIDELCQKNLTRLALLESFKSIQDQVGKTDEANQNTPGLVCEKIRNMGIHCNQIFKICRLAFCKNKEEQQKFLIFMFINKRSLYEMEIQSKIDKSKGSDVSFIIMKEICNILPKPYWDLSAQMLTKIKPKPQQKQEFEKMLSELIENINQVSDTSIGEKLTYAQLKFLIRKALNHVQEQNYKDGLNVIILASKSLHNYLSLISIDNQNQEYDNLVNFKQTQIFKIMGQCLEKLKFNSLAIRVYGHIRAVHLLMKCHERIIREQTKKKEKREAMEAYAQTLIEYGKKVKAIELYQQMIDQFECFPESKKIYKSKILELLDANSKNLSNDYVSLLREAYVVGSNEQLVQDITDMLEYHFGDANDGQNQKKEDLDEVYEARNKDMNNANQ